ncbi:MAG: LPS export ABC transporter ATP-binding protein [Spirochaetaceae bacterium]|nr:LPS export ABC transporter ATP-binding protein [Spirochaetaceae bacterium]
MNDRPEENRRAATLAVSGLRKRFGRKVAVDGISFRMAVSEVVGLLGPNGAGKTTAFFMIAGFIEPSEGSVLLGDRDITRLPMYRRARLGIAYLPQEPSVFRRLTVRQNVLAVLETRRLPRGRRHDLCDELLAELGIEEVADQKAHTLSGGERRRTEIARSLASDPRFLLLDEPFAGIDPIAVHHLKEVVRSLAGKGIGILLTDHNVRDALEITDRSYIIDGGHIIAEGSREALLADPAARSAYLGEEFRM